MNAGLLDAFRHNAWATLRLLAFCRDLSGEQLRTNIGGGYGNVLETLRHVLGAEAYYRFLFSGSLPDWDWVEEELPTLDQLERWAADMAAFWEELLAHPIDADAVIVRQHEDGSKRETRAGIVLAQALHHGNIHREQVCAILTALGIQPPDLQVWTYGTATGRNALR
jgi:uncharacterized damage-inducible protein DinB